MRCPRGRRELEKNTPVDEEPVIFAVAVEDWQSQLDQAHVQPGVPHSLFALSH